jgi:hypothetical protein
LLLRRQPPALLLLQLLLLHLERGMQQIPPALAERLLQQDRLLALLLLLLLLLVRLRVLLQQEPAQLLQYFLDVCLLLPALLAPPLVLVWRWGSAYAQSSRGTLWAFLLGAPCCSTLQSFQMLLITTNVMVRYEF